MSDKTLHPVPESHTQYTKRDAETQMALGIFITFIAIPVIVGTFWATTQHAAVVNVVAGVVLLGIGVGMAVWGWRTTKKVSK